MERSDTIPLFMDSYEIFEDIIQNSSFHDRLDSKDIRDIFTSSEDDSENSSHLRMRNNLDSDAIFDNENETISTSSKDDTENSSDLGMWNNLDSDAIFENENETIFKQQKVIPAKKVIQVGDAIYLFEDEREHGVFVEKNYEDPKLITPPLMVAEDTSTPSTSPSLSSPSLNLQPWKGNYDFNIRVETATHSNNKWAFSTILKKLFLKPFDAVPIEVQVSPWIADCYVNITPVYTSSQHTSSPVNRCHNHKNMDQEKKLPYFEHIVQVDNYEANYRVDGLRHCVDIPLGVPAPGQSTKLIYVKCGCWNTCTGGPSRKAFCLVFTLFNSVGEEIGRQILNLKVCACPVRDSGYSEKKFLSKKHLPSGKTASKAKPKAGKKSIASGKGTKRVKVEPTEQQYEHIPVPVEISAEVKKYINRIMAEKLCKENNLGLPYPEY